MSGLKTNLLQLTSTLSFTTPSSIVHNQSLFTFSLIFRSLHNIKSITGLIQTFNWCFIATSAIWQIHVHKTNFYRHLNDIIVVNQTAFHLSAVPCLQRDALHVA